MNKNFKFKKKLGQNFLIDKNIVNKIIASTNINKNKSYVIEIGPGNGALSDIIIKNSKKLILIELDKILVKQLEKKYKNYKNYKIINEDVLKLNLKKIIKEEFININPKDILIVSNLPYYITSSILFKIFELKNEIKSFTLMMQKEVGERILALPNSKKYNNLTIFSNYFCDIKNICYVKNTSFIPKPKVDSIVLNFTFNVKIKLNDKEEKQFLKFIKLMFLNKRKTILNNLKNIINSKEIALDILKKIEINSNLRPENLKLNQFFQIFNEIKNNKS